MNLDKIIALDSETTGVDPYHGSLPFFVTTCDENFDQEYWEWDVDPYTRIPYIDKSDLIEIRSRIREAKRLVFQNSLFDIKILQTVENIVKRFKWGDWPWDKTDDTLLTSHLISSSQNKDLTTLAMVYLGIDVQPYEDGIHEATEKCRRITRNKQFREEHGEWAITDSGRSDMPSAGPKKWKGDMWLPKAMLKHAPDYIPDWEEYEGEAEDHPWATLLEEYANSDTAVTLPIFLKHQEILKAEGLWSLYEERRKVLSITHKMKDDGVTINQNRRDELYYEYQSKVKELESNCLKLADYKLEKIPVNGRSNELNNLIFNHFGLKTSIKSKKTGNPSMNRAVIDTWLEELDQDTTEYKFLDNLIQYRQRQTAISYLDGYEKYWLEAGEETYKLHPSLNPTGTSTLRWSSKNPNEQNISKKEGFNLRYAFGPAPGRYWASLDFNNIELRIPAYESGEERMIEIFEQPDEPPYFGSVHLLNASIVFEEEFWPVSEEDGTFKKKYPELYGRTKNFGFAVQYGAVLKGNGWGTADKASGVRGSHKKVASTLKKMAKLNRWCIAQGNKTGFIETIPDLEINPDRGYPLQLTRTRYEKIKPTLPLNYRIQGSACWVIFRAMIKVQDYLDTVNEHRDKDKHWFMTIQCHDELVIDFPQEKGYKKHLRKIADLMIQCGTCINTPLTVSCELHKVSWDVGTDITL